MKKIVSFFIVVLLIGCASKKEEVLTDLPVQINKLSEEYSFKIKEIVSDSRCPEGVNCVWAGEVELILSIYKEGVFYKDEPLTINFINFNKNKWVLEKYTSNKEIKSIEVLPEKKQGVEVNLEDYLLNINFD
ncbi:hypothetical protein [Flavobacterium sp.]|jgi:hypothetical protein|uniref:hypothetical protein n=1 Tax=Flavobacterium sp. TaxID=239 RepID=UPI002A838CED|nr:hypothetical protein [Flavobacterium sp.]